MKTSDRQGEFVLILFLTQIERGILSVKLHAISLASQVRLPDLNDIPSQGK
jgi:hypothetical protein